MSRNKVAWPERRRFMACGLALGAAAVLSGTRSSYASGFAQEVRAPAAALAQNTGMPRRKLGSLEVSAIGLGCRPW